MAAVGLGTHHPSHTLKVNQSLPERIIVFRDGVGEGREEYVSQFEVPQFNSCFAIFGELA